MVSIVERKYSRFVRIQGSQELPRASPYLLALESGTAIPLRYREIHGSVERTSQPVFVFHEQAAYQENSGFVMPRFGLAEKICCTLSVPIVPTSFRSESQLFFGSRTTYSSYGH